ncbi:unnamed protein product, partial [Ixodes pacificus]
MVNYKLAEEAIEARAQSLQQLGRYLWENPELGFEEVKAHDYLAAYLESQGFHVSRNYILPTAFRAEWGGPGPVVALLCEYDALPNMGHACGHNLIAEASVAAAVGVKAVLDSQGPTKHGKVVVLGTPAEETGSGKQPMIEAGALRDVDAALMAHTGSRNGLRFRSIAVSKLHVVYKGRAAHAGQVPWDGVNALDAAVSAYVNVSVLRQQMKPTTRVHGVITEGGVSPNVIPERTVLDYSVRAPTTEDVLELKPRVEACFRAAAEGSGCSVSTTVPSPMVKHLVTNEFMVQVYRKHAEELGMQRFVFEDATSRHNEPMGASTDAGNVSHEVPLIHPSFDIGTTAINHTPAFAEAAATEAAHQAALVAGKALARTVLDVLDDAQLLRSMKNEHNATFPD